ncbi:MAG: flagellar basal body L-ring protein FlgH [Alphaproteobacteria bacterium]|nr:flagellar basal body L-ring protein FlgH [Alphaproteobacteria bacterium]
MKPTNLLSTSCLVAVAACVLLSGCSSTLDKLDNIGKAPPLEKVANPAEAPTYEKLSWPMPENAPPERQYAGSLWQPGSRAFFRDQRAARVGDILRVNIKIKDKAQFNNETEGKRDSSDTAAAPSLLGFANKLKHFTPIATPDPTNLVDITGARNNKGTGKIKRDETIETQVAALITQVLPNGNLVVDGKQEINVNFEVREVSVRGVVRPQDIKSDNSVDSTQIAEARIVYGGRGQLTDVQQGRWGQQAIDAISPF